MPPRHHDGPPAQDSYRVNRRIRVPEVRVIADNGDQLGVLATHEALRMAEEKGLDLVEVSPKAMPPVCRIMDYGKFKYEQSKKTKQARKHASTVEIKEIKFRPKTDKHDLEFKITHIRRFLEEGNKVRLVVGFRGREIVHPETGRAMIDKVIKHCSDIAHVEQLPLLEGKRMVTTISPRASVAAAAAARPVGSQPPTSPPGVMPPPSRPPMSAAPPPRGPDTQGGAPAPGPGPQNPTPPLAPRPKAG